MSQQDEFMQKLFGGEGGEADSRQKLAEAIQAYLGENFVAMLAPETQIGKGRYPPRPCPNCGKIFAGIYCPHDNCGYREPEE